MPREGVEPPPLRVASDAQRSPQSYPGKKSGIGTGLEPAYTEPKFGGYSSHPHTFTTFSPPTGAPASGFRVSSMWILVSCLRRLMYYCNNFNELKCFFSFDLLLGRTPMAVFCPANGPSFSVIVVCSTRATESRVASSVRSLQARTTA